MAVMTKERMRMNSCPASSDRKPPDTFWRTLFIRKSRSAALIVKLSVGVGHKAQDCLRAATASFSWSLSNKLTVLD